MTPRWKSPNGIEMKKFAGTESWGGLGGGYAMTLYIGHSERELDDDDYWACHRHIEAIENIIRSRTYREDPTNIEAAAREKGQLLGCFGEVIYAEPIPNEYWGAGNVLAEMSPWFRVTTTRGHFKIGWRKRVIVLDWSETEIKAEADDLFASEDVTKNGRVIHCYGYAKASEYIAKLMAWQEPAQAATA